MKRYLIAIFFIVTLFGSVAIAASNGTIDPNGTGQYQAAFLDTAAVTDTRINFGKFTTESQYDITVSDTELRGYAWGASSGYIVMNCADTTSGCSNTNGNFKVANDGTGKLSGYAWGSNTGWVNFGPFTDPGTSTVKIGSDGNFGGTSGSAGYAWSQTYGWIIFDCSNPNTCVHTDWSITNAIAIATPTLGSVTQNTVSASDTAATGGTGPYTYQWKRGTVSGGPYMNIPGATTLNLTDTGLTASTDYYYVLQVTDAASAVAISAELHATTSAASGGSSGGSGGGAGGSGTTPVPPANPPTEPNPPVTTPPTEPNPPVTTPTPPVTPPTEPTPPANEVPPVSPSVQPTQPPSYTGPSSAPEGGIFSNGLLLPPTVLEVLNNLGNTVNRIVQANDKVSTVVSGVAAATTVAASVALLLLANPFSFAELFLLPFRLWTLLLVLLGLKKRHRPWGTVYDSVTKQPIDPAYVILTDMQGNEVATSITDIDGRYGFAVPAGTYRITANKTNYDFPSVKLAGKTGDELYAELYFGETIVTTAEGEVIAKNIPLDQKNFDWNEFAKGEQKRLSYYHKSDLLIAQLATIFFWCGFAVAAVALLSSHTTYNGIVCIVYVVMFIVRHYSPQFKEKGSIVDSTGQPLSFAILHVLSVATGQEVTHKVADRLGNYYCLVPNGTYTIAIDRKNPDGSYTKTTMPTPITVKDGYLKESFTI